MSKKGQREDLRHADEMILDEDLNRTEFIQYVLCVRSCTSGQCQSQTVLTPKDTFFYKIKKFDGVLSSFWWSAIRNMILS